MRYLVTGGAGFIGAALSNRLAADGHEVRVIDDLSNGSQDRLASNVMFTKGAVNDIPRLWTLLQDVDCVYHLAARVSVAESLLYPQEYNATNVGGTVALMEAMRDAGVRRVVFASSGAVYGEQSEQPVHENDVPMPDSPYAVSKFSAEQYVRTIGRLWEIETVSLRIFNAYGPNQSLPVSHAPVVPRFLRQAQTGGSLVLYGDGSQSRDFVYITDVVAALISASTARLIGHQVINIGSGQETSLNTLVDTIEAVLGKSVNRLHNKNKSGGVQKLVAETSRAASILGYRPITPLSEGIKRILANDPRFVD
ncbi:MAG: NAD-dependent epimerase/dehydratase family protein [Candidatus Promineifilaceae bacterium]